jgi:hypothetical protein
MSTLDDIEPQGATMTEGAVFEVGVLDVPARKRDLVEGDYDVDVAASNPGPVAVRITDMLGEEILVVEWR